MKLIKPFLLFALTALPTISVAQVATTAGSNLTAWNGNSAATNNNNWNQLTNSRAQANATAPKADFGNCNSLIMRCAQPKCTGCTTIDVARPIVAGCVNSNNTCKQHGNDLIDYIAAQLVATANQKAQQAELAAQTAAAQAAAAQAASQNNAQIQQMQQQMANMQQMMQQQSAQQMAQMQSALNEQKAMVAAAQAEAAAAKKESAAVTSSVELTQSEQARAASGNENAELMARERIQGQILSEIESAEDAMKNLKSTMQSIFTYAGCDSRGNNCRGPKRVSVFKDKAMQFFEPFDNVADAMYDALEKALAVGVDVSDVIMMLSGACNQWAKYMCAPTNDEGVHKPETYEDGKSCIGGRSKKFGYVKGGQECTHGMIVPPQDDTRCTFTSYIDGTEELHREWLDVQQDDQKLIRVGCPTLALEGISILGRSRSKKQSALDLDALEMLINQDAPTYAINHKYSKNTNSDADMLKYCALSPEGYDRLVAASQTKKLPKKVCIESKELLDEFYNDGVIQTINGAEPDNQFIPVYTKERCEQKNIELASKAGHDCRVGWVKIKNNNTECDCDSQSETDNCSNVCECRISEGNCVYYNNDFYLNEDAVCQMHQLYCKSTGGANNTSVNSGCFGKDSATCALDSNCKWDKGLCILKGANVSKVTTELQNGGEKTETLIKVNSLIKNTGNAARGINSGNVSLGALGSGVSLLGQ